MRFHIGFSKYISIKALIKFGLLILFGLLSFFGIDKITANALIVNTGAESVRTCPYNDVFTSSSCVLQQSIQCQTGYGLANCYTATTSNTTMAQKSTWYHFVTNTSNSNCNTSQTVSFNASVILNQNIGLNGNNTNNWFDPNALNYPAWQTTPTTRNGNLKSVKENVNTRALFTGYWAYLADWTGTRNENKNGVRLYWKTPNNTFGDTYCNFLSYGNNNLTLNYSCTAPAKQLYYQVGINQYNNAGGLSSSNIYSEASLKISGVSDPCASGGSSGGTFNDSNIVEAINDNTLNTTNAIDGLTDAVNSATADIMDKQDLTNDKLDDINNNLDEIGDSIDRLTCNKLFYSSKFVKGTLNGNTGVVSSNIYYGTSDYIKFSSIKKLNFSSVSNLYTCFYKNDKSFISCMNHSTNNLSSIPTTAVYFRATFSPTAKDDYIEYCTNLNGSDTSQNIDDFKNNLSSFNYNQDLESIFKFPFEALQNLEQHANTCGAFNLDFSSFTRAYGGSDYVLSIPCLSTTIKNTLGNDLYNTIDILMLFGLFICTCASLYLQLHNVVSGNNGLVDDMENLRNNYNTEGNGYYNAHVNHKTGEVRFKQ